MDVKLNVYSITKANWFSSIGLGAYHTGVQIGTREYCFSDQGIAYHEPRKANEECKFDRSIVLGKDIRQQQFNGAINELRKRFPEGSYNLVKQNCNHFSDALSRLLFERSIPKWINRTARLGVKLVKDVRGGGGMSGVSSPSKPKPAGNAKNEPEKKVQKINPKAQALLQQLRQDKEEASKKES